MTRKTFNDLRKGDPLFNRSGKPCGTVVHVQDGAVFLDLGFKTPTTIRGEIMEKSMARLGTMDVFCNKDRGAARAFIEDKSHK